jgi:hypothetical protein
MLLLPATVFTDVWRSGGKSRHSSSQACVLTLVRSGRLQQVTGRWSNGHVEAWTFSRVLRIGAPASRANVRLLADGRVTKVCRR